MVLSFNPLDRGNLYQIHLASAEAKGFNLERFNPLDRGNLYQM